MRLARFAADVGLFAVVLIYPWIVVLYAMLHFSAPHLVTLTKKLDAWPSRFNVRLY